MCVLVGVLVFCVCLRSVARVQRLRLVRQIRSPSGKETRVELVPAAGGADGAYALRSKSFRIILSRALRHARKRAAPATRVCARMRFDGLAFAAMARGLVPLSALRSAVAERSDPHQRLRTTVPCVP